MDSTIPWFQFRVDETTRKRLYVPERIRDLLASRNGKYYVFKGHNNTPFPVVIRLVEMGPIWRCYIEDGWTNFLDENDIQNGDAVEMFYIPSYYFRVNFFRNGLLVKGVGEEENIYSSDDEGNADDLDNEPPTFKAKVTKPYLRAGRLYVPVTFARENLNGFPETTYVQMVMGRQIWDALLHIKYDATNNIVLYFLNSDVRQMIKCNFVQPGESLNLEYYGDVTPPLFYVNTNVYE